MIASGVLSSCEASDVNCFSRSIAYSILSNKLLMFYESAYNSSLFAGKGMRICKLSRVI